MAVDSVAMVFWKETALPLWPANYSLLFHRPLSGNKLYCLVIEAHMCEQLAQRRGNDFNIAGANIL